MKATVGCCKAINMLMASKSNLRAGNRLSRHSIYHDS